MLVVVGLYLILALETTSGGRRSGLLALALCILMALLYAGALALPATRTFFALAVPSVSIFAIAAAGVAVATAGLWFTDERFTPRRSEVRSVG